MPSYIVTLKDDATEDEIKAAKQHAIDQGGKITQEYSLIKAFAVEMKDDAVTTLEGNEHVKAIEKDGQASIC
ncbi:hypothetical protein C2857_000918 [Epichloe festucae Fl1]|uniref:Inhibitor I9 domain-containing protein n=1 Tax=Epichloe festucae (strain Fl1) TaxID=877507 RepID=A0A7U3SMF7_EPIFF|nr:hypothetical protein C2857_000918 [Epichloe festucae Fl1]